MENCNRMIYSKNDIYKVREYYKAGTNPDYNTPLLYAF